MLWRRAAVMSDLGMKTLDTGTMDVQSATTSMST